MAAVLETTLGKANLEKEYISAKITASPHDYTLTDRILFYGPRKISAYYNIFNKTNESERFLCFLLKLNVTNYLDINPTLRIDSTYVIKDYTHDIFPILRSAEIDNNASGTMIKYNNLIIDENALVSDLGFITFKITDLLDKSYLKALEVWFLKSINKSSLIPNLLYLNTEYADKPLNDIENLKFAEENMNKGIAPLVEDLRREKDAGEQYLQTNRLLNCAIIPFNFISPTGTTVKASSEWEATFHQTPNYFLQLGLGYAISYGVELLYYFNNIKDPVLKTALETLLSINYYKDSFCSKFLYTFDDLGRVEINPEILGCFDDDNEIRFENIRGYYNNVLRSTEYLKAKNIYRDINYYGLPIFFARMISNMHAYAYQICKVKHATLLYNTAKLKGVLTKDTLKTLSSKSESTEELVTSSTFEDAPGTINNELLDITSELYSVSEKDLESEKDVSKDISSGPSLDTADMLKKDLYSSNYDFDISYVKHDARAKESYDAVANNIKFLSQTLTRQIKNIKTYNTGGKQGGQLIGKLDKKNLWKYKTDPHIFYNNNYKIKEMDLAFGCILDESGSMHGEKIKNGRIVMILLHEVLNSLGINHSIIGHTSTGMYQSTIFKYYQFKEEQKHTLNKPYGLTSAYARAGNCDSGALYYMQSVMKTVHNKDKIVIIFSDGEPTECTGTDLIKQVRCMEKEGIHVIGVGINFDTIKDYYADNANGRNLNEMVNIVVDILKRYVLEKKEK